MNNVRIMWHSGKAHLQGGLHCTMMHPCYPVVLSHTCIPMRGPEGKGTEPCAPHSRYRPHTLQRTERAVYAGSLSKWPLAPAAAAQLVTHTSHFNHRTVGHTNHAQGLHKIGTCHTCHTCCHTCHTCCHTCHTCCHTCHTCRTQWPPSCSLPTAATANCCHCKP